MPTEIAVTLPYWLDRPAREAVEIARNAEAAGVGELWLGEMATFEGFSLAGALAVATSHARLVVGPLPVTLRDPTLLAMGVASVSELGARPADLALGASSPVVTEGWHGVAAEPSLQRFRDTIGAVRLLLAGDRGAGGFRLRVGQPGSRVAMAAFGPKMLELAGELADVVVLNLVTTDQVQHARARVLEAATRAGRPMPRLAVWVPAALDDLGVAQLARGLAVYLAQPGYGEMFAAAGFGDVVAEARAGRHPKDLSPPTELVEAVGAVGSVATVRARIDEYGAVGTDVVCLAPAATDADPGAAALLQSVLA